MKRRPVHLGVLFFATVWFVLVVPAHQRGLVRLPGAPVSETAGVSNAAGGCRECLPAGVADADDADRDDQPPAPGDPSQHCAVCKLIAQLDMPTALAFFEPRAELLAMVGRQLASDVCHAGERLPYLVRGPPVA